MKEKNVKIENLDRLDNLSIDEGMDIFGEHKTREQVLAEEKQQKKEQREALRQEMKRRREAAKGEGKPARRKDIVVVSVVMACILLLGALALFNSFRTAKEEEEWTIDESRGHFIDEGAEPQMSGAWATAAVAEAYYTKNGHLYVKMLISNYTANVIQLGAVDIEAFDYSEGEVGEQIAGGRIPLEQPITLQLADTLVEEFYISPEHIMADKDAKLPGLVSFRIFLLTPEEITKS